MREGVRRRSQWQARLTNAVVVDFFEVVALAAIVAVAVAMLL